MPTSSGDAMRCLITRLVYFSPPYRVANMSREEQLEQLRTAYLPHLRAQIAEVHAVILDELPLPLDDAAFYVPYLLSRDDVVFATPEEAVEFGERCATQINLIRDLAEEMNVACAFTARLTISLERLKDYEYLQSTLEVEDLTRVRPLLHLTTALRDTHSRIEVERDVGLLGDKLPLPALLMARAPVYPVGSGGTGLSPVILSGESEAVMPGDLGLTPANDDLEKS